MEANRLMQEIYSICKRLEGIRLLNHRFPFNNTEMQMIKEILRVKETGGRIISSELAKVLGVTRSAVSQMVNKLEAKNIVKRVADDTDRKIAYIELSDSAKELYENMKGQINELMSGIIARLGERKVDAFVAGANEFIDAFDEEAAACFAAIKAE